jgi:hypothetical protein
MCQPTAEGLAHRTQSSLDCTPSEIVVSMPLQDGIVEQGDIIDP